VPRNFVRGRGVQQIQLTEGRENGDLGAVAPLSGVPLNLQMSETCILIRFLRNWEFGSALSKLRNFGGGGGPLPPLRYATVLKHDYVYVFSSLIKSLHNFQNIVMYVSDTGNRMYVFLTDAVNKITSKYKFAECRCVWSLYLEWRIFTQCCFSGINAARHAVVRGAPCVLLRISAGWDHAPLLVFTCDVNNASAPIARVCAAVRT
jgi:hypothetical protein